MSSALQLAFDTVTSGSIYALVAVGFAFLFSAGRYVNFACGQWAAFSGMTAAWVASLGFGLAAAGAAAPLAGATIGIVTYQVFLRHARSRDALTVALLLLALGLLLEWLALQLWGPNPVAITSLLTIKPLHVHGALLSGVAQVTFTATVVTLALLVALLKLTRIGQAMTAWADNPEAAALSGIDVHRVVTFAFAVAGALAGLAGFLLVGITGLTYLSGMDITIKAFGAAAIGAFHSAPRAAAGGYLLGFIEAASATYIGGSYTYFSSLVFIVVILIFVVPAYYSKHLHAENSEIATDAVHL